MKLSVPLFIAAGLALAGGACLIGSTLGEHDSKAGSSGTAPKVTATSAASPTKSAPKTTVEDGTWTVGTDLTAGSYRTVGAGSTCYWAITKSGSNGSDIVTNHVGGGNLTVTLQPGQDFETQRCGAWTKQ